MKKIRKKNQDNFIQLRLERSFARNPRFSVVRLRIELRDTISNGGGFSRESGYTLKKGRGKGWKSLLSGYPLFPVQKGPTGRTVETARRGVHCSVSGSRERHRLSKIPPSPSPTPDLSGSNFRRRRRRRDILPYTCLLASNFRVSWQ